MEGCTLSAGAVPADAGVFTGRWRQRFDERYASVDEVLEILEKLIRGVRCRKSVFYITVLLTILQNFVGRKTSCGRSRRYFLPGSRFCFVGNGRNRKNRAGETLCLPLWGRISNHRVCAISGKYRTDCLRGRHPYP